MGRVKGLLMDYQERVAVAEELAILVQSEKIKDDNNAILIFENLQQILASVKSLDDTSFSVVNFVVNLFDDSFCADVRMLRAQLSIYKLGEDGSKENLESVHSLLTKIKLRLLIMGTRLHSFKANAAYNSDEYYKEQIADADAQKNELEKVIENLKKEKDALRGQTDKAREEAEQKIREKEGELASAIEQIAKLKTELEDKKRQDNAIEEWNGKIKKTFGELKTYLLPIKEEHTRLKNMYWAYVTLSALALLMLVVVEAVICYKFCGTTGFPAWRDYFALVFPTPVAAAILWASISQMNRAQRQLVVLAKHIHEVEYVEGVLLSINSLSVNIGDSMRRVNAAIDRLLENHLSAGFVQRKYNEEDIISEEKKDVLPVGKVIELIKSVKDVSAG